MSGSAVWSAGEHLPRRTELAFNRQLPRLINQVYSVDRLHTAIGYVSLQEFEEDPRRRTRQRRGAICTVASGSGPDRRLKIGADLLVLKAKIASAIP